MLPSTSEFIIISCIVISSFFGNDKWQECLVFYEVSRRYAIEKIKKGKEE